MNGRARLMQKLAESPGADHRLYITLSVYIIVNDRESIIGLIRCGDSPSRSGSEYEPGPHQSSRQVST